MKSTTWHVIPANTLTYVTERIFIYNFSDRDAHVELTSNGELLVKPLDFGRLSINYLEKE